jgi:chromosome segregation ATPase
MKTKDDPKKLVGEVQALRMRVAAAEAKVKLLRDQARQAKRRRKEAKRMAQRARKQFKQFKSELTELQQTLAEAEKKLSQIGTRAPAQNRSKAGPGAKRVVRRSKKSKRVASKPRKPGRVTQESLPTTEAKFVSAGPADVAALDHTPPPTPPSPANS